MMDGILLSKGAVINSLNINCK